MLARDRTRAPAPLLVWAGGLPGELAGFSVGLGNNTAHFVPTLVDSEFTLDSYLVFVNSVGATNASRTLHCALYALDFPSRTGSPQAQLVGASRGRARIPAAGLIRVPTSGLEVRPGHYLFAVLAAADVAGVSIPRGAASSYLSGRTKALSTASLPSSVVLDLLTPEAPVCFAAATVEGVAVMGA